MSQSDLILHISTEAVYQMLHELELWTPKESGGVLMGYREGSQLWITHLIGPGPKAVHERFSFTPDNEFHEKAIAAIFHQTKGRSTYLGDWHTHPDNKAYLSGLDKQALKNIATYPLARLSQPVMIIMGSRPFEVKAWLLRSGGLMKYSSFSSLQVVLIPTGDNAYR